MWRDEELNGKKEFVSITVRERRANNGCTDRTCVFYYFFNGLLSLQMYKCKETRSHVVKGCPV